MNIGWDGGRHWNRGKSDCSTSAQSLAWLLKVNEGNKQVRRCKSTAQPRGTQKEIYQETHFGRKGDSGRRENENSDGEIKSGGVR